MLAPPSATCPTFNFLRSVFTLLHFLFFLCTFDFELCLLSPHVILDYSDQEQVFTKCLQMERRLSLSFTNNKSAVIKTKNMNKSFRILI